MGRLLTALWLSTIMASCSPPPADEPRSSPQPWRAADETNEPVAPTDCVCEDLACGPPNCEYGANGERGWYVNGFEACGMQVSCCSDLDGIRRECAATARQRQRQRTPAVRPAPRPARPAPSPPAPPVPPDLDAPPSDIDYNKARVQSTCPKLSEKRAPSFVGRTYDNAFRDLPDLKVNMSSALGRWGLIEATRAGKTIVLLSKAVPSGNEVVHALELDIPCPDLAIETNTCAVSGKMNPVVFALMESLYTCGGHAESSPVRAWRMTDKGPVRVKRGAVTCGSFSCEVDPPPGP